MRLVACSKSWWSVGAALALLLLLVAGWQVVALVGAWGAWAGTVASCDTFWFVLYHNTPLLQSWPL
jgi:hypothetical protein